MGNTEAKVLVSPESGSQHLTFNYIRYEPGAEFPQHVHDESEDVFIITEGSGWFKEGEKLTPIGPGDVVFVPSGEMHGTVASPDGMVAISCQSPPHESTFSRAFDEFTRSDLPQQVHEALIETHQKDQLKGHISRDSTAIEGNEKPISKPKEERPSQAKRSRGRPKKGEIVPPKEPTRLERQQSMTLEEMLEDLPKECDRGTKKNSQGYKESWNGYKLHLDCVDGQIPISCFVTSASVHDSQAAIPLSEMSAQKVTGLYELMDAAYDAEPVKDHIRSLGHVPIIDSNPRRGEKIEMDPATQERYKERSSVERVFGRLKEEFGASHVKVRGHAKVTTHLMFGILALTADQLLRLVA